MRYLTGILVVLSLSMPLFGATITTTTDATALVNAILGSGVTIVGTPTLTFASANQQGIFSGAFAELGFDSGIVLSSGEVDGTKIFAPNEGTIETIGGVDGEPDVNYNLGGEGHPDLDDVAGGFTYDANVLTFSFLLETDATLFFNFVFASEEYIDFVGQNYNDSFAFFLNGQNIALIAGVPVGVDTVNPNINGEYYINNIQNDSGLPNANLNIRFDGLTRVLQVRQELTAGTHQISLMIADTLDDAFDSAVFIQAGTFSTTSTPTEVPEPGSFAFAALGLGALAYLKKACG